jgi:hypothetical protein
MLQMKKGQVKRKEIKSRAWWCQRFLVRLRDEGVAGGGGTTTSPPASSEVPPSASIWSRAERANIMSRSCSCNSLTCFHKVNPILVSTPMHRAKRGKEPNQTPHLGRLLSPLSVLLLHLLDIIKQALGHLPLRRQVPLEPPRQAHRLVRLLLQPRPISLVRPLELGLLRLDLDHPRFS